MKASLRIAARSFGAFTINSTPAPWPACQSTNFFRDALADRNLVPDRKRGEVRKSLICNAQCSTWNIFEGQPKRVLFHVEQTRF